MFLEYIHTWRYSCGRRRSHVHIYSEKEIKVEGVFSKNIQVVSVFILLILFYPFRCQKALVS